MHEYTVAPEPAAPRTLRFHSLANLDPEETSLRWDIEDLLPRGSLALIGGEPKTFKSFITLDAAVAVASGQPFLGHAVSEPGPVILLNAEDSIAVVNSRLKRILAARGIDPALLPVYVVDDQVVCLDQPSDISALCAMVRKLRPRLVIIDCLRRCMKGSENDSATIARLFSGLRGICREFDCSIGVVHHFGKRRSRHGGGRPADRLRGSTDLFAAGDAYWFLSLKSPDVQRLEVELRAARAPATIDFSVVGDDDAPLSIDVVPPDESDRETEDRVLAALEDVDGASVREMYELVPGRRRADVDAARRRLLEQGKVTMQRVGRRLVTTRRIVLEDEPADPARGAGGQRELPVDSGSAAPPYPAAVASPGSPETAGDVLLPPTASQPPGDDALQSIPVDTLVSDGGRPGRQGTTPV